MKKEIDYKWHDVRKTPIDLPIEKEKVIVCYLVNNSKFYAALTFYNNRLAGGSWSLPNLDIIAWQRIEEFVEED